MSFQAKVQNHYLPLIEYIPLFTVVEKHLLPTFVCYANLL